MKPMPYDWWLALTEGMLATAVRGESWRVRIMLSRAHIDAFVGATVVVLDGKTPKSMQYAQLQSGASLNGTKIKATTQPFASVEFDRTTGYATLKITAALFRGDSMLRGYVDALYPMTDPPSGAPRWVYTLSARAWVDPRDTARATARELRVQHPGPSQWGLGVAQ